MLRSRNTAYAPKLTAWIFLAEGLADHFESLSATAVDRFKRAYGLAVSIGDPEIRCLAAAWLGASEFLLANYEAASLHAAEAIQHAPDTGYFALSRAHLVLANCLNAVDAEVLASKHYARARHFAIEARDISMQSSILYNVAAFHVSRISIEDAFGQSTDDERVVAELEVSSINNLDAGIGLESLRAMVPLLRAQLLLIAKKWSQAEALYSEFTSEAAAHGQSRLAPRYLAERAQCQAMLGQSDNAARLVTEATEQLSGRVDPDDRAACHARLSLCLSKLGRKVESRAQFEAATKHRAEFAAFQIEHRTRIVSISEGD
jgi:tetratricopeptide (TPR) repeat protein